MVRKLKLKKKVVDNNIIIMWQIILEHITISRKLITMEAFQYQKQLIKTVKASIENLEEFVKQLKLSYGIPTNFNSAATHETIVDDIKKYSLSMNEKYFEEEFGVKVPDELTKKYNVDSSIVIALYSTVNVRFYIDGKLKDLTLNSNIMKIMSNLKRSLTRAKTGLQKHIKVLVELEKEKSE